jgi:hypothetical protein
MNINNLFKKEKNLPLFGGVQESEPRGSYVGVVGVRQEFILTCTDVIPLTSGYSVKIYRFVDELGNVVVNFAKKDGDWFAGNKYRIKAKVKRHSVYQGVRQTAIYYLKTVELFYDHPPVEVTDSVAWDAI